MGDEVGCGSFEMTREHWESLRSHRFNTRLDLVMTAIGTGVSGCFYGFAPILESGIGIAFLTTLGIGGYYLILIYSDLEVTISSGLQTGGASFEFVGPLLGIEWGILASWAELVKLLANGSLGVAALASYICLAAGFESSLYQIGPGWALVTMLYAAAASRGSFSHKSQLITTWMCLIVIFVFVLTAIPVASIGAPEIFKTSLKSNTSADAQRAPLSSSLVFAVWLYMGVEGISLCSPQTAHPSRLLPPSIILACIVLVLISLSILLTTVSVLPIDEIMKANVSPLFAAFKAESYLPKSLTTIFGLLVAASLWPSLNGFILYTTSFMTRIGETEGVPYFVQSPLAVTVFGTSLLLYGFVPFLDINPTKIVNTNIWLALAGAVTQYACQFAAYLALQRKRRQEVIMRSPSSITPREYTSSMYTALLKLHDKTDDHQNDEDTDIPELEGDDLPYDEVDNTWRSPLGEYGAAFGLLISAILGVSLAILSIETPVYRPGTIVFFFILCCALIHALFLLQTSSTPPSSRTVENHMEKNNDNFYAKQKPTASTPLLASAEELPSSTPSIWSFVGTYHR